MHRSAFLRFAVALAVLIHASTLAAASLWFGDKDGLHRIDSATNQVVSTIPFEPTVAIAVNAGDGSVWAISQDRLARLSENGVVQFEVALRDLGNGLGAPRLLVLDPNDGSVWAGFENRVLHVDAAGAVRHAIPAGARDLAVAQDGSVWILGQSALAQHDSSAALIRSVALQGSQRFKHLALDDAGGVAWLAGEKDLVQVGLSDPGQASLSIAAPGTIAGISVDLQTGNLWVIGQNTLFSYGRDGQPGVSRDLRDFSIANPQALLFDFSSQAAWVGHQQGLTRITPAGTVAAAFPAAAHVVTIALGRAPVSIVPVVSITAPANGALLNTATPQLRVDYDALCGTVTCGFPNSFFAGFTLSALVNGTETGSSFVFDPATGGASFTPATPLPEGLNTFSARARDGFGRFSETVTSSFTVDTVAPAFVGVTPASGTVVSTASLSIAGSVDDAAASVTLGDQTPQGQSFSFPLTLAEGSNTFTLVARDAAGNTASLPLTYVYEPPVGPPNVLPVVQLTSPAANASYFAPAAVQVAATASDADGTVAKVELLRNGFVEATLTAAPYAATLAVPAGTHTLAARATDDRGGVTTSAPVTITVTAPSVTIDSPAANAAIPGDTVVVRGRIVAPPHSGVHVNGQTAALDAAGNFAVLVPVSAGANTLTATLTLLDRTTVMRSVSITASGALSQFGVVASPEIGFAPMLTTFSMINPTAVNATFTFDGVGPFFLPAGSISRLSVTYPAGLYAPTIVFNVNGAVFTHRLVLESRDRAHMDQIFRSLWSGLNDALVAGDKDAALRYLSENGQQKYGPVFDALLPFMAEIVASYSPLAESSISESIAEYAVTRLDGATKRLYLIYFLRDASGIWRIDGM